MTLKQTLRKNGQALSDFIKSNPLFALIILLCVGGFYLFAKLAFEVLEGERRVIDTRILLFFRDSTNPENPLGPPWLPEMMRDMTALGGIGLLTIITVATIIYMVVLKKYGQAIYISAAVSTGVLLSNLLKIGFDRPRPDLVPHDSIVYMPSFPSGHSLMAAIVYLTLGALLAEVQPNRALKVYVLSFMVFLTALTGVSRIYLGVHWPSDVLAGWLVGFAWALLAWIINHQIKIKWRRK